MSNECPEAIRVETDMYCSILKHRRKPRAVAINQNFKTALESQAVLVILFTTHCQVKHLKIQVPKHAPDWWDGLHMPSLHLGEVNTVLMPPSLFIAPRLNPRREKKEMPRKRETRKRRNGMSLSRIISQCRTKAMEMERT